MMLFRITAEAAIRNGAFTMEIYMMKIIALYPLLPENVRSALFIGLMRE